MTVDYDEYTFTYTKEFQVSSSLIDSAWFNENDGTVVLDVDDDFYLYSGVTGNDVASLVAGDERGSVGAYYNKVFKGKFGPGEHLGYWSDWEPVEEEVKQKVSTGPHVTLNISDNGAVTSVSSVPVTPTKEFSLAELPTPGVTNVEGDEFATAKVYFNLDGVGDSKLFEYTAATSDVYEAIEELNQYVSRIGTSGKVRKVVVEFV